MYFAASNSEQYYGGMMLLRGGLVLLLWSSQSVAYQLQDVVIPGEIINQAAKARVVLPDSYAEGDIHYKTIYLLHGWSGDYSNWTEKTAVAELADQYNVILVMPDGGYDKWYIDSPLHTDWQYQRYIGQDVVQYIDQHFRTEKQRTGRAITGLSMGGFGALNIAVNYPETFAAAGSMSGGVDPRAFSEKWGLDDTFGSSERSADFRAQKAIINNIAVFDRHNISLILHCGRDDIFLQVNQQLSQALLQQNISHRYIESAGKHDWFYWQQAVTEQLPFLVSSLQQKTR